MRYFTPIPNALERMEAIQTHAPRAWANDTRGIYMALALRADEAANAISGQIVEIRVLQSLASLRAMAKRYNQGATAELVRDATSILSFDRYGAYQMVERIARTMRANAAR